MVLISTPGCASTDYSQTSWHGNWIFYWRTSGSWPFCYTWICQSMHGVLLAVLFSDLMVIWQFFDNFLQRYITDQSVLSSVSDYSLDWEGVKWYYLFSFSGSSTSFSGFGTRCVRELHFFWTVVQDLSGMPPRYSTVNDLNFFILLSSIYWKANSWYCTVRWFS